MPRFLSEIIRLREELSVAVFERDHFKQECQRVRGERTDLLVELEALKAKLKEQRPS